MVFEVKDQIEAMVDLMKQIEDPALVEQHDDVHRGTYRHGTATAGALQLVDTGRGSCRLHSRGQTTFMLGWLPQSNNITGRIRDE